MRPSSEWSSRNVTLIDFAAPNPSYDLNYSERMVRSGISVSRCTLPPNAGQMIGATQLTVAVHESGPLEMEWRLPSALHMERRTIVRDMAHINPADHPIYQRWPGRPSILVIALDRAFLEPIVNEAYASDGVRLQPHIGLEDSDIEGIARAWRRELREGGAGGRLFAEGLATVLALHLFRRYGEGTARIPLVKGGLGPVRLSRVITYIDSFLNADIGMRDLAAVAEVSPSHFNEQFKISTGQTPFRFILERRIARAKELLLDRGIPIAEVALRVGFANQSHFTVNFKKGAGTTPARFRADST